MPIALENTTQELRNDTAAPAPKGLWLGFMLLSEDDVEGDA